MQIVSPQTHGGTLNTSFPDRLLPELISATTHRHTELLGIKKRELFQLMGMENESKRKITVSVGLGAAVWVMSAH